MLLVRTDSIPTSVETELDRLDPVQIVVLGGPAVVSNSVQADLSDFSSQVVRRAGADRYKTAVAVSAGAFTPDVQYAFIATGPELPRRPVGRTARWHRPRHPCSSCPGNCIPTEVQAEIDRLTLAGVTILGGTTAVSASVATGQSVHPGQRFGRQRFGRERLRRDQRLQLSRVPR